MDGSIQVPDKIYIKQFQFMLIAHLAKCENLMKLACDKLTIADFELSTCQVLWEALQEFYMEHKTLPGDDMRGLVVEKVHHNVDGKYRSYITPEEGEAMLQLLDYVTMTVDLNPEYFMSELPNYVKWVRTSKSMSQYKRAIDEGADASHFIQTLAQIEKDSLGFSTTDDDMHYVTERPEVLTDYTVERRITTGTYKLDTALDGGPRPGDIGCITACPGTGKTNVLLHFACVASLMDIDCLFMSLELPAYKVKRRYLAMTAEIPANTTKLHIDDWPHDEQMRLAMLMNKHHKAYNKCIIMDKSQRKVSVPEIEDCIGRWKEKVAIEKGSSKNCLLVCLDWLKYIVWPTYKKNAEDWEILTEICRELGMMAKRLNVALWTANQGKATADGKIILRMNDTAGAYHINDALDYAIGLALSADSRVTEEDLVNATKAKTRELVFSINKNRENNTGVVQLFQAPTLRFFDSDNEWRSHFTAVRNIAWNFEQMHRTSLPKYLHKLYDDRELTTKGNNELRTGTES